MLISSRPALAIYTDTACCILLRGVPVILEAVGELKVPWIGAHLVKEPFENERGFGRAIGQVVEYMIDQGTLYIFHSTYDETSSYAKSR